MTKSKQPFLEFSSNEDASVEGRLKRIRFNDEIDSKFGFERHKEHVAKTAWLMNMHPAELVDENKRFVSAVDYYFIQDDGARFKVSLPYKPYFYVAPSQGCEKEVASFLSRKYSEFVSNVDIMYKDDLDLSNHLMGLKRAYVKLSFYNVHDLMKVKRDMMPRIRRNNERQNGRTEYTDLLTSVAGGLNVVDRPGQAEQVENIVDIREYDVPYHVRVSIDLKIFVGHWYTVTGNGNDSPEIVLNKEILDRPDPVILAFDIETTKAPLKFPDSQTDQIMMISYMIDGQGYLIVNRQIVSADIDDFEYTPRPEYEGRFTVFNEADEQACIVRFFDHIQMVQPHIISTYNGDSFDWPFVEVRAAVYGLDMTKEIGFAKDSQGEYKSRPCIHMDAFKWVKRDSYLPIGSQNLKATTRAKLRYNPIELDPELMCRMAQEKPQVLASYSVSDAVATYYLYMKYVHPFIFALCMIIPMEPDEVLRKGSGTLCEALLMVEAFHCNVIFPNKQATELRQMTEDGHLIESETYVGGHVEALESGIFRADIPCRFRLSASGLQKLIDEIEGTMKFAIEMEGISTEKVTNFQQKCAEAAETLANLRDSPSRLECPLIYHLDVGAMYPNIILTNRLQPPAIINEATCAACDFNRPGAKCQRAMDWMWRGEIVPATRSEYQRIVQQLENEKFPSAFPNGMPRAFHQLSKEEQVKIERKRLQEYCKKAYKRIHETRTELRVTTVCQRENSFYVDTVRAFRDRRYEYKALLKGAKKNLDAALKKGDATDIKSCKSKEVLYDSLQLAHKCILNSFYGYVMRKGSRWHSMEMAGIVCYTGANIITKSKELVDQIGRPLELDTDGIWCILPKSFPENIVFAVDDPRRSSITISYPCAVLNVQVKDSFTNDQYHTMVKADGGRATYEVHSENSIAFEVDGPYKAIVLPAAKEEGKRLKKRYAVFNFDGSIAELKGFEVKRRGELELIKIFQSSVFDAFLNGGTLEEVYQCVAKVADYWLDVLFTKGIDLPDSELFDLISENRNLSRKLEDYGEQKSTSITTAKRLAEFLGDEMVKDAGLNCQIVIAKKPEDAPVTERAIPMVIFQTEPTIRRHYLRKWLKCPDLQSFDIRDILDWNYYIERLGSAIQKIITIPAAMQGVPNPVPRVPYPDWLHKRLIEKTDVMKQKRITEIFAPAAKPAAQIVVDMEEIGTNSPASSRKPAAVTVHKRKRTLSGHFRSVEHSANRGTRTTADATVDEELNRPWRSVLGEVPPMGTTKEEKQAWLSFMKQKWVFQKRQRAYFQRRSRTIQAATSDGGTVIAGLSAFVQRSARALLEQPWQIIQVLETSQPGIFRLWILTNGELRQIRLRVPRIFYINQRTPKDTAVGETYRQVHRILPRANRVHYLYEYQVEEKQFQEQINLLQSELSAPHVEGIYESQVPLTFRIFAQLGCLSRVTENQKQTGDLFTFSQLEFLSLAQASYLESDRIGHLYLYHYAQDSRSMLALFSTASRKSHVFVVDKSKTNSVNMANMYSSERNKRLENAPAEDLPPSVLQFEVDVKSNVKEVYRSMQRLLKSYKTEMRGPNMVLFESSLEAHQLLSLMPAFDEFPLVKLRVVAKDKLYSTLDWQRVGARHMINGYLNSSAVLQTSLELCRYLHIPLGNIPEDPTLFGADLFFARCLWKQNYVLWCSPVERPDFGGKEVDDNRLITDFTDFKDLSINRSRLYDCVCFELDVASVPVTALLQANRITEFEGVSGAVGFDAPPQLAIDEIVGGQSAYRILSAYDETALCAGVFRALKTMVHSWVKDITIYQNVFADNQIVHFYRWLCSTSALLYDPALKRTVNGYMKKLLLLVCLHFLLTTNSNLLVFRGESFIKWTPSLCTQKLIADLKRLGSVVVYASASRLIISTNKISSDDALGYIKYILQQLQHKELFATLDLTINQCWKVLMWLDPANFGGIKLQVSHSLCGETVVSEDDDEAPLVDMNWNMMYFLPEAGGCQTNFKMLVAGYMVVLYQQIRKQEKEHETGRPASPLARIAPDVSNVSFGSECANKSAFLKRDDDLVKFRQDLITGELNEKFYGIVDKIKRKLNTGIREHSSGALFPVLPGRHLNVANPALEFVKAICKVLSLDQAVEEEVAQLRRDLLKLAGISEFADEAQWVDPCLSYVLSEVICRNCNYCRDLDLCRDPYSIHETTETGERPTWRCVHCKIPYDVAEIEGILIKQVNSLSMSYGLQDLKCGKCKRIKQAHMNIRCECGGQYVSVISTGTVALNLKTFSSIANYYNMKNLQETLHWIVILNPLMKNLLS